MKSLILIITMSVLVASCGKKSSSSSNTTDIRDSGSTVRVEDHKPKLKCLEGKLGWLDNPPMTKNEIFKRLSKTSYVGCDADSVIVGIYTEQVLERHPNIQFKDQP